jgi:hypothetical protein
MALVENDAVLTDLLSQFAPLTCWKVGLIYGSMLYFDMNDRIVEKRKKGGFYIYGSATLHLDGNNWNIYHHGIKIANSYYINRDIAESSLHQKFVGQRLLKIIPPIQPKVKRLTIVFSDELEIMVRQGKNIEYNLVKLYLPDGSILCWDYSKGLYIHEETHSFRASCWQQTNSNKGIKQ